MKKTKVIDRTNKKVDVEVFLQSTLPTTIRFKNPLKNSKFKYIKLADEITQDYGEAPDNLNRLWLSKEVSKENLTATAWARCNRLVNRIMNYVCNDLHDLSNENLSTWNKSFNEKLDKINVNFISSDTKTLAFLKGMLVSSFYKYRDENMKDLKNIDIFDFKETFLQRKPYSNTVVQSLTKPLFEKDKIKNTIQKSK